MNSQTIKTMVVHLSANNVIEVDVDCDIFDDPHLEAATQAIERCKIHNKFGIIRPIIECWDKKDEAAPKKHHLFNTYWVLINAASHKKAEYLREKFQRQHDVDLEKQPVRGHVK